MKYGKLINGQLEIVVSAIETPMGILNLSKEVMLKKGAKSIIDNPLNYDKETQILEIVGYTELEEEIIVDYTIKEKNPPITNEERIIELETENERLKFEQEVQDSFIDTNLMANAELYEMILNLTPSPIETMSLNNNNAREEVKSMVEVYVALILKGLKTIDQVPALIRPQVEQRLKELEVTI